MKAVISYSHNDMTYVERLHTHLAVLRREGAISAWFDREILAGSKLDRSIIEEIENCDLFLAMVSPDFLASNYCYETEMTKAMQQDASGTTRIVPIIVEPCDWKSTPLRQYKALPRDGKPISEWHNANTGFLDIVNELRRIVTGTDKTQAAKSEPVALLARPQGVRRYKPKRDFDAIDRSDFRIDTFTKIRDYLQSCVAEINGIEDIKARFVNLGPYSFSCSVVNRSRTHGIGYLKRARRCRRYC